MTETKSQPQRKPRPIAIIEQLDDGSIRILPVVESEEEAAEIEGILRDRIKTE